VALKLNRLIRNLKILPRWVIIFIDLLLISFSALLGFLLRFNFSVRDLENNQFQYGILLYTTCGLLSIVFTNSYRGIIRYTGLQDGVRIFFMGLINLVLVCTFNLVFFYNFRVNLIPYSVVFISLLSSFLLLFNYRLLVKYIFSYYRNALIKRARVMIFGAGQTGMITRHVIESTPRMQIVGFLEDDPNKVGKILDGARIYGAKVDDIESLFREMNVDELVFTAKDISLDRKNELVDICIRCQVRVRTIPPVEKWVRGELSFNQIKEINIEDLLGRESIKLNNENARDLRGKKILITGAAGSIGMELVRQVIQYTPESIVLIDQSESAL